MKTIAQSWAFRSSSGDQIYQTLRYTDGSTSCDCPGWTRRVGADGSRTCKHTRSVEMGVADSESIGMAKSFSDMLPSSQPKRRPKASGKAVTVPERRFNFDE